MITSSLSDQISTHLDPGPIAVVIHSGDTSVVPIPVSLNGSKGQAISVRRERDSMSSPLPSSLTIDVSTDLGPAPIVVFVDSHMTSLNSIPTIAVSADGQATAIS